jgi:hypothetical protein
MASALYHCTTLYHTQDSALASVGVGTNSSVWILHGFLHCGLGGWQGGREGRKEGRGGSNEWGLHLGLLSSRALKMQWIRYDSLGCGGGAIM